MPRPSWATRPLLILLAILVLAGGVVIAVVTTGGDHVTPPKPIAGVASDRGAVIPASGGVSLAAEVITPRGSGPFPLVVMPGSWGAGAAEYTRPGQLFASKGYQVVAYAQRGFGGSGGDIDFAGPATQGDVTTVVDWALAHTAADKTRIGMLGISLGAGMSLLAAGHDPRIKAVVAMSGWSSLVDGLAPNDTPNVQSMHVLLDKKLRQGVLVDPVRQLASSLSGPATGTTAVLNSMTDVRSAAGLVTALNQNHPAIMLASAYEDSILDPSPLVQFFAALTTPKRWQLAPGDHGGPEEAGLLGQADQTFADARAWLDHYVRGAANGIDKAEPIQLVDGATGKRTGYRSWPTATTIQLATPNTGTGLVAAGATPWSRTVTTGTDSGATSGPPFVLRPNPYRPPTIMVGAIKADRAWIWDAAVLTQPAKVSGSPAVTVEVASSAPTTTLFAYLYDVTPAGRATLMTYAPETTTIGTATFALRPTSWTVATGHHVRLVIDTVDPRYASAAPSGSSLTLSSSATTPATLSLPLG